MLDFISNCKQTIIKYKKQLLTFALIPVFMFRSSLSGFALSDSVPFVVEVHNYDEDSNINYGSSAVQIDTSLSNSPYLEFDIVIPNQNSFNYQSLHYVFTLVGHVSHGGPVKILVDFFDSNNVYLLSFYDEVTDTTSNSITRVIDTRYVGNGLNAFDVSRALVKIQWPEWSSSYSETLLLTLQKVYSSSGEDFNSVIAAIQSQTDSIMNSGSQFGGTTSGILSGNDVLSGFIDDYTEIEQSMYDKFTENQTAVIGNFSGFSWGSLSTAVDWTSDYLNKIYDNSGDFRTMFMYPILAGIALIFIGRQGLSAHVRSRRDK